jgi:hypothetical protein
MWESRSYEFGSGQDENARDGAVGRIVIVGFGILFMLHGGFNSYLEERITANMKIALLMVDRGDGFHDCWANIGHRFTWKIRSSPGSPRGATGFGRIRAACRRVEATGARLGNPVQPPTVFELEEALGERVQTVNSWERTGETGFIESNSWPAMLPWRNK